MRHMRLGTQMLVILLLVIAVLFSVQMTVITQRVSKTQREHTDLMNLRLIQSAADELAMWLNQRICEIRIVAQDQCFGSGDIERINTYLSGVNTIARRTYGDIGRPFVYSDANGIVVLEDGSETDISQREFYYQAFASDREYTISKPLISQLEWDRVVVITYPLQDADGEKTGYLVGSLLLDKMNEVLSDINVYDGTVYIMDAEGRVLAEDNNHEHGDFLPECPKSFRLTQIASRLSSETESSVIKAELGEKKDGLLFSAAISYTQDWRLCVFTTESVVYAPLFQNLRVILVTWAAMLLVAVFICTIFIRRFTVPLTRLARRMEHFDPHLPVEPLTGCLSYETSLLSSSFDKMSEHIRKLIGQVIDEQQAARQAEFNALQAQINPHFLYNTLDTVAWKALDYGADEISDIIHAMSEFFRISLSDGRGIISINDELEHVYSYLFIQQVRYADKLAYNIDMDEKTAMLCIPKLTVQPLVENALYHGLKPKKNGGSIEVRSRFDGSSVEISVSDDGVGMEPEGVEALNRAIASGEKATLGYGLFNIAQRLRLVYGEDARLNIKSERGTGTTVVVVFPAERWVQDDDIQASDS